MDELIARLEGLTNSLMAELEFADQDRLGQFMDERQQILSAMQNHNWTEEEKAGFRSRIATILTYDAPIQARMRALMNQAHTQTGKIEAGKIQRSAYDNRFHDESYFFDRKW
ncbi:MAG: hypothetical protein K0R57_4342 [Paenibacillaceae bacterium]|jgi:hypothetical protein|nr:hypothetical protein [Paenibacillaceae bacterium]